MVVLVIKLVVLVVMVAIDIIIMILNSVLACTFEQEVICDNGYDHPRILTGLAGAAETCSGGLHLEQSTFLPLLEHPLPDSRKFRMFLQIGADFG